jgi:hypothetical protein
MLRYRAATPRHRGKALALPPGGSGTPGNPAPTIRAREVLEAGLGPPISQDLPASRQGRPTIRRTTSTLAPLALAAAALAGCATVHPPLSFPEAQAVDYCELVQHPEQYQQRVVKLTAAFAADFDDAYIFDLRCPGQASWYAEDPALARSWQVRHNMGLLGERPLPEPASLQAIPFTRLTFVARFESGGRGRYGSKGRYDSQLMVLAILRAEPPSLATPPGRRLELSTR